MARTQEDTVPNPNSIQMSSGCENDSTSQGLLVTEKRQTFGAAKSLSFPSSSPPASTIRRRSCLRTIDVAPTRRLNKRVSFDRLAVREYAVTLGNHPSTSSGPPIQLSWDVQQTYELNLLEYEEANVQRRSKQQLLMPAEYRKQLLRSTHSEKEIEDSAYASRRARSQRALTQACQEYEPFEVAVESLIRKLKRWRRRRRSGNEAPAEPAALWIQREKLLKKSSSSSVSSVSDDVDLSGKSSSTASTTPDEIDANHDQEEEQEGTTEKDDSVKQTGKDDGDCETLKRPSPSSESCTAQDDPASLEASRLSFTGACPLYAVATSDVLAGPVDDHSGQQASDLIHC